MSLEREDLLRRLRAVDLGRVADRLVEAAEPSVRFTAQRVDEASLPVGSSKLGGRPDVRSDFPWPSWKGQPLSFLGQIDLADVVGYPGADALPESGLLLFFYEALAQGAWGFDPEDRGSGVVVYASAPRESLVRRDPPPELEGTAFGACALRFRERLTLPWWQSIFVQGLELSNEEVDRYDALIEELEQEDEGDLIHQILGHPIPIQNEMQLECQLVSHGINVGGPAGYEDPRVAELAAGATAWRLLLQLDSEEAAGMMWGDMGRLYFWIRAEDLADFRFEESWLVLQCG